jgi:hypothetical protein
MTPYEFDSRLKKRNHMRLYVSLINKKNQGLVQSLSIGKIQILYES